MIALNIVVGIFYLTLVAVAIYTLKLSIRNLETQNSVLPQLEFIKPNKQKYKTLAQYLAYRYTPLALLNEQKIYAIFLQLSVAFEAVCLLQINKLTIWPLSLALIWFVFSIGINELYEHFINRMTQKQRNSIKQTSITSNWVLNKSQILLAIIMCCCNILQIAVGFRIFISLSNLGLLNITSLLTIVTCDMLLFRPTAIGLIIGTIKLIELWSQNEAIYETIIVKNILLREYARTHEFQIILPPRQSPKKQPIISSVEILKHNFTNDNCQSNDQLSSYQFKNRCTQRNHNQSEFTKVEDIKLNDKQVEQQSNSAQPQYVIIKNELSSQNSESQLQSNKENIDLKTPTVQKKQINEDIYLAENFFPTKHQINLPVNINLSPSKDRKRLNRHRKNNRVLILSGNSPYLEYLPNMLKKQQSETKMKTKEKLSINPTRAQGIKNALREIRK